jgi:hypothetical protein
MLGVVQHCTHLAPYRQLVNLYLAVADGHMFCILLRRSIPAHFITI